MSDPCIFHKDLTFTGKSTKISQGNANCDSEYSLQIDITEYAGETMLLECTIDQVVTLFECVDEKEQKGDEPMVI